MRPNKLRSLWTAGGVTLNGWLTIPNSWSAEVMAHAGWQSVTIDMQHGFSTVESAMTQLQAISTTDVVPLVRASWNDPLQIQRLLDAGAYGVICPLINNRAECERFVGACRYPPLGYRSIGPTRAVVYAGADYAANANQTVLTFAMVETAEALANLDEILSVPGLDGVFVGPGDLGLSLLGRFGPPITEPVLLDAITRIADTTRAAGKIVGTWCATVEDAILCRDLGYQFITISSDSALMTLGAKAQIARFREGA